MRAEAKSLLQALVYSASLLRTSASTKSPWSTTATLSTLIGAPPAEVLKNLSTLGSRSGMSPTSGQLVMAPVRSSGAARTFLLSIMLRSLMDTWRFTLLERRSAARKLELPGEHGTLLDVKVSTA